MMRFSEACTQLRFNIRAFMCCNAIPHPIRCASCDYMSYRQAINRTFLLQRIEILMLLHWFSRFDLCLWLKLSARVVTWLESREHQIVDVFTGNLRVLSSSRSSRSFTDCFHFLPWSNGKAMNLVPLGVQKWTPFWTSTPIPNRSILEPQNDT